MWYTLFSEGERFGAIPMMPLWYEFPGDEADSAGMHMIRGALLDPVIKSCATQVNAA